MGDSPRCRCGVRLRWPCSVLDVFNYSRGTNSHERHSCRNCHSIVSGTGRSGSEYTIGDYGKRLLTCPRTSNANDNSKAAMIDQHLPADLTVSRNSSRYFLSRLVKAADWLDPSSTTKSDDTKLRNPSLERPDKFFDQLPLH